MSNKKGLIVILLVGGMVLLLTFQLYNPDYQTDIHTLAPLLPILEQYRVENFRDQEWCKNIVYQRGAFSSNLESSTCNLFNQPATPFDHQAQEDFALIEASLAQIGLSIYIISAQYNQQGQLIEASFEKYCRVCLSTIHPRSTYIYHPNHNVPEENIPNQIRTLPINQDWYLLTVY